MSTRILIDIPPDLLQAANIMQYANRQNLIARERINAFKSKAAFAIKQKAEDEGSDDKNKAVPEYRDDDLSISQSRDKMSWFCVWQEFEGSYTEDRNVGIYSYSINSSMNTSIKIGTWADEDDRFFQNVSNLSFVLTEDLPKSTQFTGPGPLTPPPPLPPGSIPDFFTPIDWVDESTTQDLTFTGIQDLNESTSISIEDERRDRVRLKITTETYRTIEIDYKGIGELALIKETYKEGQGLFFISVLKVPSKRYLYFSWRGFNQGETGDGIFGDTQSGILDTREARDYSLNPWAIPIGTVGTEARHVKWLKRLTASETSYEESQKNLPKWMRGNVVDMWEIEPPRKPITNELARPSILAVMVFPAVPFSGKNDFPYQPNTGVGPYYSSFDIPFQKNTLDATLTIAISRRNYGRT